MPIHRGSERVSTEVRDWLNPQAFVAEGGIVTLVQNWIVHTFTISGVFSVLYGSANAEMLVVAGGGGGGNGGGGAGGVLAQSVFLVSGTYTVTVGAGGTSGINAIGGYGNNSVFGAYTATGGGGGGKLSVGTATDGGSGGGGGGNTTGAHGHGTAGQGYDGGDGTTA
jgi:hypothetical protein